jgi:MarR family transcriptional regulator, temperature-dependent positive regulator of motility
MTTLTDAARRSEVSAAREAGGRRDVFRLSESPSHLLRRAEQFATEIFAKAGLTDGVTLRQTVLLAAIAEAEGASQSGLVRATGVDRSTLAEMMARMERKGLIARSTAADDGRAKSVHLTASGRARLDAALPAMRAVDETLMLALPRNKRTAFRSTLAALAIAVDEAHDETMAGLRKAKKAAKARKAEVRGRKRKNKKKKKR